MMERCGVINANGKIIATACSADIDIAFIAEIDCIISCMPDTCIADTVNIDLTSCAVVEEGGIGYTIHTTDGIGPDLYCSGIGRIRRKHCLYR